MKSFFLTTALTLSALLVGCHGAHKGHGDSCCSDKKSCCGPNADCCKRGDKCCTDKSCCGDGAAACCK